MYETLKRGIKKWNYYFLKYEPSRISKDKALKKKNKTVKKKRKKKKVKKRKQKKEIL